MKELINKLSESLEDKLINNLRQELSYIENDIEREEMIDELLEQFAARLTKQVMQIHYENSIYPKRQSNSNLQD